MKPNPKGALEFVVVVVVLFVVMRSGKRELRLKVSVGVC